MSYSLLLETKKEESRAYWTAKEILLLRAFSVSTFFLKTEWNMDKWVSSILSFHHPPPRRAPRSLGSALRNTYWLIDLFQLIKLLVIFRIESAALILYHFGVRNQIKTSNSLHVLSRFAIPEWTRALTKPQVIAHKPSVSCETACPQP